MAEERFVETDGVIFYFDNDTREYSVKMNVDTLEDLIDTLGDNLPGWLMQYTEEHKRRKLMN